MRFRSGFTLIELLVVMAIIALLVSLLLPVLGAAKESVRLLKCQSNQRSIGQAMHTYITEYEERLPYAVWQAISFDDVIGEYLQRPLSRPEQLATSVARDMASPAMICPNDPTDRDRRAVRSYVMIQGEPERLSGDTLPAGTGVMHQDPPESILYDPTNPRQLTLTADVPAASDTLLLSESAYRPHDFLERFGGNEQGRGDRYTVIDRPSEQLPGGWIKGRPVQRLHGSRTAPTPNYLYTDGHVRAQAPGETVGDDTDLFGKPDGQWTRLPND
jgi:prepilin-type N-terminal cleavage/methylation domain-containing protein/prepilin-type processing-associated H-X9-DG protein